MPSGPGDAILMDYSSSSRLSMSLSQLTRILVLQTANASPALRDAVRTLQQQRSTLTVAESVASAADHLADDDKYDVVIVDQTPLAHAESIEILNAVADAYSRVLLLARPGSLAQTFPSRITVHGVLEDPASGDEILAMAKEVVDYRPKAGAMDKQRKSSMNQALIKRQSARARQPKAPPANPAPGGDIRPQSEPLGVYARMADDSALPAGIRDTSTSDRAPAVARGPGEPANPPVSDALPVQPSEQARMLADSVGVAPPTETRNQNSVTRHRTPEPQIKVGSSNTARRVAPKLPGAEPAAAGAPDDPFANPSSALPAANAGGRSGDDPFATASAAIPPVVNADPFATNSGQSSNALPPIARSSSGQGRSRAPALPNPRAGRAPAITPLPIEPADAQQLAAAAPTVQRPPDAGGFPQAGQAAQPSAQPAPNGYADALGIASLAVNLLRPSGFHAAQWELPTREGEFGNYAIMHRLGAGAMGIVYLAYNRTTNAHVALKVLQPAFAGDPEYIARFYREARECSKLDHPNIVRVLNVGAIEGHHFIALQYVDGPTLHDRLAQLGTLDLPVAVDFAIQLLAGLAYAHSKHCVHRDIKPSNIMVTSDNVLKITDFGLSRNMAHETALTRTGVMMGTPGYMPLEQWDARSVDHRADLFAAGVSFYEMLTGRLPYPGDTPTQILRAMILGKPTPLVQYRRDCPPSLVAVVLRLLAQRPEDRYQHAAQAVFALRDWERQQGIERVGGTPAQMPSLAISESQVAASRPVVTDSSHATAAVPDAAIGGSPMSAHFTTPPPAFSSSASSRSRAPALPGAEAPSGSQPSSNDEPDASGTIPPDGPLGTNNSGLIPEPVPNP